MSNLIQNIYETPALWAGEEYFELFMWPISSYEAIFGSALSQTPTFRIGSASKLERARACHNSTEPFFCFEAEPASDGSTDEDAND